jgi:hypothetical protein
MSHDRRKLAWAVGVASALALVAPCAVADDPPPFAYEWPLETAAAPAYTVELPQEAYAWASPDGQLGDVVVVDAQGREVAAGLYQPAPDPTRLETADAVLLAVPGGSTDASSGGTAVRRSTNGDIIIESQPAPAGPSSEWVFDAHTMMAPRSLQFPVAAEDSRISIDVDGSRNLQDWTPLTRGASVVSLGQGNDRVEARNVQLGGGPMRYFRISVRQGAAPWQSGQTHVTLAGLVSDPALRDEAKRRWLDVTAGKATTSGQGVDYEYTLPAALPVSGLRVRLGQGDSVARLDAASVDGPVQGEALGTLVVTPQPQDPGRTLNVEARRRSVIRLHSATPLRSAPLLSVGWRPDRLVFLPEGQAPYRLRVGSATARRGAWPVDDAIGSLRKQFGEAWRPGVATVGEGHELGGKQAVAAPSRFDWTRPILWIVLVLGAVMVVGMAAALLRGREGDDREQ